MQLDDSHAPDAHEPDPQGRSRGSLTTMAVNRLRDLIVTGELKPAIHPGGANRPLAHTRARGVEDS